MRIGVDCDGVLADFNTAFINRIIAVTGHNDFPLIPFDIPTWNYPQHFGYTEEEVSDVWKIIEADPEFWLRLPSYADTQESLRALAGRSHAGDDLYFITSRPGIAAKRQTEAWLRKNGFADRPTVLISSDKGLCAAALNLDVYLDDRWENALDVSYTKYRACPTTSYLLTRPWNVENDAAKAGIVRVASVAEFLESLG